MKKKEKKRHWSREQEKEKGKRIIHTFFFVIFRSAHKMRQLKTQKWKIGLSTEQGGKPNGEKRIRDGSKTKTTKKKRKWKSALGTFFYRSFLVTSETRTNVVLFLSLLSSSERKVFLLVPVFLFFYFFETASVVSSVVLSSTRFLNISHHTLKRKSQGGKNWWVSVKD